MLSFTSFHFRGALNIHSIFCVPSWPASDLEKELQTLERVLPNQGKGRVAEHYARIRSTMRNICARCWGNLFIPCHTLDLKGEAYGHHDYPKPDHRACH